MISFSGPIVTREAARAAGLKRYFSGVPCKRGHSGERNASNGGCVECNRVRNRREMRQRYASDPERHRKRRREYTKRVGSPERWKLEYQRRKAYFNARVESGKAGSSARKWKSKNLDAVRSHTRNRRARKRAAVGFHTAEEIEALYKRQHGRCAICFKALRTKYTVDHIKPLSRGGSNDVSNLQLACKPCNSRKWTKDAIAFARELGRLL